MKHLRRIGVGLLIMGIVAAFIWVLYLLLTNFALVAEIILAVIFLALAYSCGEVVLK